MKPIKLLTPIDGDGLKAELLQHLYDRAADDKMPQSFLEWLWARIPLEQILDLMVSEDVTIGMLPNTNAEQTEMLMKAKEAFCDVWDKSQLTGMIFQAMLRKHTKLELTSKLVVIDLSQLFGNPNNGNSATS